MKEATRLSSAILRTRGGEQEGFEELFLLTYKDTYADIRSSVEDEEYIWNTIRDVYVQVYNRRSNMPEANLIRQWIRILIKDVAKQKGGVDITEFPDVSQTEEMKALEPKANTTLIAIEDQLGLMEDEEDEAGSKKYGLIIAKIIVAAIVAIAAIWIVVWVFGLVRNDNPIPSISASGFVATSSESAIVVVEETTASGESYGWNDTADGKRYKQTDGSYLTQEWLEDNNDMYYFDEQGYMAQGVKTIDGQRFVFAETGELTSISRSYDKETQDTILSLQMKQFGDEAEAKDIVADSITVKDGWIYYLSKAADEATWPMLLRYKNGEGSQEFIDNDVLGYFIYEDKIYYCKDNKMASFLMSDSGTPITGGYQYVVQGNAYYLKDSFGRNVEGNGGYATIDGRTIRIEDGKIKYVKPGSQVIGSYSFTLNTSAADNKVYVGGVPYVEQGLAINSICTVGQTLYYSAINRIGENGAPVSQIYAVNIDTGERAPITQEFQGAMLNMYYYKDTGNIYMEYAPDSIHSAYGGLAVMGLGGGGLYRIDDSSIRGTDGSNKMLELIGVQDGIAYCYMHTCSYDGSSNYLTVLSTTPIQINLSNITGLN